MKKHLLDLLKHESGFLVFYAILIVVGIIEKNVFTSSKYWLVLVLGNLLYLFVMAIIYAVRSSSSGKK